MRTRDNRYSRGSGPRGAGDEVTRRVARRLKAFFRLADLRCSQCGEFHEGLGAFGISTPEEWEERMDAEVEWLLDNRESVSRALPLLEAEWPECCRAVEGLLRLPVGGR